MDDVITSHLALTHNLQQTSHSYTEHIPYSTIPLDHTRDDQQSVKLQKSLRGKQLLHIRDSYETKLLHEFIPNYFTVKPNKSLFHT